MPNVTISVPDKLKAEMDKLSEVSWSEICRNAISRYIAQRKNPNPIIELSLPQAGITHYSFETGYPSLMLELKIHNRMDSEITIDRVLVNAKFVKEGGFYPIGSAYDLRKRNIGSNSTGGATIHLILPKEKIRELENIFKSTFECQIRCIVFVEGFRNEYNQEVKMRIPIDDWNDVVTKALNKSRSD